MKVLLISCSNTISTSHSYTAVSALLRRSGHSVKKVILVKDLSEEYTNEDFIKLDRFLDASDVVMMSIYTLHAVRAVEVTKYIHAKFPGLKVFWGGPHCITAPEVSLEFADGVCFAEGDITIPELMDRLSNKSSEDYFKTPNMAFRVDGKNVINKTLQPNTDLDSLPEPDIGIEDLYALDYQLRPFDDKMLSWYDIAYPMGAGLGTSRGCPFACSYCDNSRFINMHGHNKIRFRSIESVIASIEIMMEQRDNFAYVGFNDDDFLSRPLDQLQELHDKYLERINIPFALTSSAATYRDEKMALLADAGLCSFRLGVQSGSERVLRDVYNRTINLQKTQEVAKKIAEYGKTHGVELILDFIIDCPYETPDDIIDTYKYLIVAPEAQVELHLLQFFPGTAIYERAVADGYIESYSPDTSRSFASRHIVFQKNYETLLVLLAGKLKKKHPHWFLMFLASNCVRKFARLLPWSFCLWILKKNKVMSRRDAELSK